MIGDSDDMAARMQAVLPARWFGDASPLLQAVLLGLGTCWSAIFGLIQTVQAQARIATASGGFLDLISADFFGAALPRRNAEVDSAFRTRISQELLRPRATRAAMVLALTELTGRSPRVFEPARPSDTGGYNVGGLCYGGQTIVDGAIVVVPGAGGWGSLALPYQVFITAYRPLGGGILLLAGYGTGGLQYYGDLSMLSTVVSDAEIQTTVTKLLPAASIAWLNIAN
jgi:hypothetical protein